MRVGQAGENEVQLSDGAHVKRPSRVPSRDPDPCYASATPAFWHREPVLSVEILSPGASDGISSMVQRILTAMAYIVTGI